jgi:hypothetical protein
MVSCRDHDPDPNRLAFQLKNLLIKFPTQKLTAQEVKKMAKESCAPAKPRTKFPQTIYVACPHPTRRACTCDVLFLSSYPSLNGVGRLHYAMMCFLHDASSVCARIMANFLFCFWACFCANIWQVGYAWAFFFWACWFSAGAQHESFDLCLREKKKESFHLGKKTVGVGSFLRASPIYVDAKITNFCISEA